MKIPAFTCIILVLLFTAETVRAESEPNNVWNQATAIEPLGLIEGTVESDRDRDYFRFEVGQTLSNDGFSIETTITGGTLIEVCLTNDQGVHLHCRRNAERLVLPALGPAPGDYGLLVRAEPEGASYRVAFPPTFLEPGDEREPNDEHELATPINSVSQSIRGRLDGKEEDHFWFEVGGAPQLWRIQGNANGELDLELLDNAGRRVHRQSGQRQVRLDRLWLLPGRHLIHVSGSDIDYDLKLLALGPPPAGAEREPNDRPGTEGDLIRNLASVGAIDSRNDRDTWLFAVHAPEHLALSFTPPADSELSINLEWEGQPVFSSRASADPVIYSERFEVGEYRLEIAGRTPSLADYQVQLDTLPWFEVDADSNAKIDAELATPKQMPAAFIDQGQTLELSLTLHSQSDQSRSLRLATHTSHHAWQSEVDEVIELPAGQRLVLPVLLEVPPDAWAQHPVRVSIGLLDADGRVLAQAEQSITAEADAIPVNPIARHPIPDELRGGINVLWNVWSPEWISFSGAGRPPSDRTIGWINDGMITLRDSFALPIDSNGNYQPTWQLPVQQPAMLAGVMLHPQGAHAVANQPKTVEILVSIDGQHFESVLIGELSAAPVEQMMVFDQPIEARFVRLNLIDTQGDNLPGLREIMLGEFAVIAMPGSKPLGDALINIALPERGGHVVWSSSEVHRQSWDAVMLSKDDEQPAAAIMPVQQAGTNQWQAEWVIGFHHQRAARIQKMAWRESLGGRGKVGFDRFEIALSTSSPAGPWTRLDEFDLPEFTEDQARQAEFEWPATWARYVRIRAFGNQQADRTRRLQVRFPDQISIFEQVVDQDYRSILGLWGYGRREAILEQLYPQTEPVPELKTNDRSSAWSLSGNTPASGFVQLDQYEHWYRIDVAEGNNQINLDLSGVGRTEVALDVYDQNSNRVELKPAPSGSRAELDQAARVIASVEPGPYWVRVHEPPWSLMFVWDNSGSMSSYLPVVYNAVAQYAQDIRPNQFANLMPFRRGAPLLDQFTDQPLELLQSLNDYRRNDSSSEAEGTLLDAAQELSEREGLRGIVMITDAATPRESELWRDLIRVQPRVFTVQVGSTGTLGLISGSGTLAQDLMQSWANVNQGYYAYPRNQTELSIAYARASAMMRRPKGYVLEASVEQIEPGELVVEGGVAGAAVEIVLDASGSMLQRMEGERRIVIARDVVTELVTQTLDARTQFTLRAFGHRNPDECFTDRILPLAPLDAAAVTTAIASIEAKNLARTPIGDALRGVSDDLRGVEGERLVVLITDGEETCDGEPEAQIAGLLAAHPETRVHIVGFAIDDAALTNQFQRWARTGRGEYFAANSRLELSQALSDALSPHFRILDINGNQVVDAVSGENVLSLAPGQYVIEVDSQPPRRIEGVEIIAGERTQVQLDQNDIPE